MASWNQGYVADVDYTRNYYRQLSPAFLNLVRLQQGYEPVPLDREFTYCELACGQGYSTNVIAASCPTGQFFGFDFNPRHIAQARSLADRAKLPNAHFFDDSFEELVGPNSRELPPLDFITLHGIYSWAGEETRRAIIEFIRRNLKVGGTVYVTYNCMPGWASSAPLQTLLHQLGDTRVGRSDQRMKLALGEVNDMLAAGCRFFTTNPAAEARLKGLSKHDPEYLVHEYLNDHWKPRYHFEVRRDLAQVKLEYAGSAALIDNYEKYTLTPEQQALLSKAATEELRETLRDYLTNAPFRRDVFVLGARKLTQPQLERAYLESAFALSIPREDLRLTLKVGLGEVTCDADIYQPMADALAEGATTLVDVSEKHGLRGRKPATLFEAAVLLTQSHQAIPFAPAPSGISGVSGVSAEEISHRFNHQIARSALQREDWDTLAVPGAAGGFKTEPVERVALAGYFLNGRREADDLVDFVWTHLDRLGQRMIKDDQPVTEREEALPMLHARAAHWLSVRFPLMEKLNLFRRD